MLTNTNEAVGVFKNFRALVEDENDKMIKFLWTDRGGEFVSNEFKNTMRKKG